MADTTTSFDKENHRFDHHNDNANTTFHQNTKPAGTHSSTKANGNLHQVPLETSSVFIPLESSNNNQYYQTHNNSGSHDAASHSNVIQENTDTSSDFYSQTDDDISTSSNFHSPQNQIRSNQQRSIQIDRHGSPPDSTTSSIIRSSSNTSSSSRESSVNSNSRTSSVDRTVHYGTTLLAMQRESKRFEQRKKTVEDVLHVVQQLQNSLAVSTEASNANRQRVKQQTQQRIGSEFDQWASTMTRTVAEKLDQHHERVKGLEDKVTHLIDNAKRKRENQISSSQDSLSHSKDGLDVMQRATEQLLVQQQLVVEVEGQNETLRRRVESLEAQLRQRQQQQQQQQQQQPKDGSRVVHSNLDNGTYSEDQSSLLLQRLSQLATTHEQYKIQQLEMNKRYAALAEKYQRLAQSHEALRRNNKGDS